MEITHFFEIWYLLKKPNFARSFTILIIPLKNSQLIFFAGGFGELFFVFDE